MIEVLTSGSVYIVKNIFTGQELQRAAEKIKPYLGSEEWLLEPTTLSLEPEPETEPLPARVRRPPRRLIEEC